MLQPSIASLNPFRWASVSMVAVA